MTLQVIGAGLGRTGTMTLKLALERLGFGPCHHMVEVLANPEQIPFWNRASDGEEVDWAEVYHNYEATVDWPGCHFFAELAACYPEAKVILSRRDANRWYESMAETILKSMAMMGFSQEALAPDHPMRFGNTIIAGKTFRYDYSRENVIAAFERHNASVIERIAPERLLVFDVADGWDPLCQFLDVRVPDEAFPRTNSIEEFWDKVETAQAVAADLA